MMVIRFFLLMQVYHWASFFKLSPLNFIIGVLLFPWHVISRLLTVPKDQQAELVSTAIKSVKAYWQIPGAMLPPECMKRRLLALETEADKA